MNDSAHANHAAVRDVLRSHGTKPLLSVRDLCKHFPLRRRGMFGGPVPVLKAVDHVSFDVMPGETLGLVGESGSGKTTAARTILRALKPTSGNVLLHLNGGEVNLAMIGERALKPLRQHMQMIFQDPFSSLNPRMTVRNIVAEPLIIHGLARRRELNERVAEILTKVGLKPEHMFRYPHAFSGGQRQRIGIARALVMRPALVVADEPVSALDVSVQAQVINLLDDLRNDLGLTCVLVAHDLGVVRHIADRIAVMYAGSIVEMGDADAVFAQPLHPYTQALIAAVPAPDPDVPMKPVLKGEVADPANLPSGCRFHPRCPYRAKECETEMAALRECQPGRFVACHTPLV